MRTAHRLAASLVVAVLTLTACGSDESEQRADIPASAEFNAADVDFATQMIPHHAQALVMVDMTRGRSLSPEFEALTEQILAAQGPEIEQMADWLEEWGQPVPETSRDHANSHDMDHMDMGDAEMGAGMMTPEEMTALDEMGADGFESMWLTMMIAHHEGAITMAEAEQEAGKHPEALALAEQIAVSQALEIEQMQEMLAG